MHTLILSTALIFTLALCACSEPTPLEHPTQGSQVSAVTPQLAEPYRVDNWYGTWTGVRPQFPLLNANGEVIEVGGKKAKVASSTFTFTIGATGTAELIQNHDDGRVAAFSGSWKGRLDPGTNGLTAIVCDLTANSTGAYRQFALMADNNRQAVMCHGGSAEPPFEVQFTAP